MVYGLRGERLRLLETARRAHEAALAADDQRALPACLGNLSMAHQLAGTLREALGTMERALALARDISDRRAEAIAQSARGLLLLYLGALDEAGEALEQRRALPTNYDLGVSGVLIELLELGESQHLDEALALAERSGNRCQRALALGYAAVAMARSGDGSGAEGALERARQLIGEPEQGLAWVHWTRAAARVAEALAGPDAAAARVRAAAAARAYGAGPGSPLTSL